MHLEFAKSIHRKYSQMRGGGRASRLRIFDIKPIAVIRARKT